MAKGMRRLLLSGTSSGVQQGIEDEASHTFFVHCAAHNLNVVLKDVVEETRDACQLCSLECIKIFLLERFFESKI